MSAWQIIGLFLLTLIINNYLWYRFCQHKNQGFNCDPLLITSKFKFKPEDITKALNNNEFVLWYQPTVAVKTYETFSAEALLRWEHPKLGRISPDDFLPQVEKYHLILALGKYVIETICKDINFLKEHGFADIILAINLSSTQFNYSDITLVLAEAIAQAKLSPAQIEIELTEQVAMLYPEKSKLMLQVLKAMGCKIALDDFGMGFSFLSQLVDYPIDIIKIDKKFVQNIAQNKDLQVVKSIISMAKKMSLKVVAEGVENQEMIIALENAGCDYLQGYYISKPIDINTLITWLKEKKEKI